MILYGFPLNDLSSFSRAALYFLKSHDGAVAKQSKKHARSDYEIVQYRFDVIAGNSSLCALDIEALFP